MLCLGWGHVFGDMLFELGPRAMLRVVEVIDVVYRCEQRTVAHAVILGGLWFLPSPHHCVRVRAGCGCAFGDSPKPSWGPDGHRYLRGCPGRGSCQHRPPRCCDRRIVYWYSKV